MVRRTLPELFCKSCFGTFDSRCPPRASVHPSLSHLRLAFQRKNRRAVKVGYALLIISLLLLISGFALMRVEGFEIRDPNARTWLYWTHVITPLLAVWLYVLHRLAGPKIKWKMGVGWAGSVAAVVLIMVGLRIRTLELGMWKAPKRGKNISNPPWLGPQPVTSSRPTH